MHKYTVPTVASAGSAPHEPEVVGQGERELGPLARLIQQFDPGGQALVTSLFRAGVSERGRQLRSARLPEGKRALVRGFMESSLKGEGAEVRRGVYRSPDEFTTA